MIRNIRRSVFSHAENRALQSLVGWAKPSAEDYTGLRWFSDSGERADADSHNLQYSGRNSREQYGKKFLGRENQRQSGRLGGSFGTEERDEENPPGKMKTIDKVVPMSKQLLELHKSVVKGDKEGLAKYENWPKDELSDEQLLLLADTIEFYLTMAPSPAPNVDGLKVSDRKSLAAVAKLIRAHKGSKDRDAAVPAGLPLGSPLEKVTVNTAPPGRIPLELVKVNEEAGAIFWGLDLTGGKARDPWVNGSLSDTAKNIMYRANKSNPEKYSPSVLADLFKVRVQRVMAILKLKKLEEEDPSSQEEVAKNVKQLMEHFLGAKECLGSNEQHHVNLPSYPAYVEVDEDKVISGLEKVLGKSADEIRPEEITKEVALKAIGGKTLEEHEAEISKLQEEHLVHEFEQRLNFNLGVTGKTISRESRRTKTVTRPKEGWSLLVKPVGKKTKLNHNKYVALPDGTKRSLTQDEELYAYRQSPRPRRRMP